MTQESKFPTLDAPREDTTVIAEYGVVEPYVEEADYWMTLPVRLTLSSGGGICIELGIYTFGRDDIEVLRRAIVGYDRATGTEKDQR